MSDERDTHLDADVTDDLLGDRIDAGLTRIANDEYSRRQGSVLYSDRSAPRLVAATAIEILDFEQQHPRMAGAKESAIRARFGCNLARYAQKLLWIIRTPEALEHNPVLVKRLVRQLDERMAARASRTFRRTR